MVNKCVYNIPEGGNTNSSNFKFLIVSKKLIPVPFEFSWPVNNIKKKK